MRVLLAIALLEFGIAGVGAARAADLPAGHPGSFSTRYFEHGQRAGMLLVYDDEPGIVVRAYWRAPWRHHHYFPATGEQPDIGRDEDLSATGKPPKRAQTYRRNWSNASALEHEWRARPLPIDVQPMPRVERPPHHPDALKP